MQDSDKPEKYVPLAEDFKLVTNNFSNVQIPLMQEGLTNALTESKITQKSKANWQNVRVHYLKEAEEFKNDYPPGTSRGPRRSSIMKLFDPLHSMQQTGKIGVVCHDVLTKEQDQEFLVESCDEVYAKEVNKCESNTHVNETLISLQSPRKLARPLMPKNLFSESKSVKKYSEEDYRRILKIQEFRFVTELSQKYSEYEKIVTEKDRLLNSEFSKMVTLGRSYSAVLSGNLAALENMVKNNEITEAKLQDLHINNENLKAEIKVSKEDLCTLENAFSDIYKRYETSKEMIKSLKENEEHLQKSIQSMQLSLDEQDRMNEMLESRRQELMGKTTTEIETAKKSVDTQIILLQAQLKKSEIVIGSLEIDLKQAKSTNTKLVSACDDLIAKLKV